jgi:putrescine transport system substrate-binding protein
LGKDPNSQKPEDLAQGEAVLLKIRPYIRSINSSEYIEALAHGDLCVAVGYNGDVLQARDRAQDANKGIEIKYSIPKEGTILWFDMLAIPKDAPHPESAYAFINFIMTPEVIGEITNFKGYANANTVAQPLASVKNDPGIYPTPESLPKLSVQLADSADQTRAITGVWEKFKTGQCSDGWRPPVAIVRGAPWQDPTARPYVQVDCVRNNSKNSRRSMTSV